ncbi:MAG: pentapeptide repeat-containing protein [Deltaproteobacteria bacterium]|nr:pentapeptide repeat-containing protein [Deltaproteobacteria bacterium]
MTTREQLESESSFDDAVFEGLELQGFDFSGKDFYRCTFRNVKLQESRWQRAGLEDCVFEDCDLTRMLPADLRAHGVRFKGCKLMGIEWTKSSLNPQLSFEDCNLRYSSFLAMSLRATPFVRCKATEANFIDVDLTEADFSESDLTGSTFQGTTLTDADLSTAQGAFIDPAKNRVKDARVAVESAVLLAAFFGMRVNGYYDPTERRVPGKGGRRTR